MDSSQETVMVQNRIAKVVGGTVGVIGVNYTYYTINSENGTS